MKKDQNSVSLLIRQESENGLFASPKGLCFQIEFNNQLFKISVSQKGFREIKLTTFDSVPIEEIWSLFEHIDSFMMLFEGEFFPISSDKLIVNNVEKSSDHLDDMINKRLNCYSSADFVRGGNSYLHDPYSVMNSEILKRWIELSEEMDLLHKMFLYSISDVGMPVDIKVAFIIQVYEGLNELLRKRDSNFPKNIKLGKCLTQIIENYGKNIFAKEISFGLDKLIKVFVESRNRIAHIRNKEDKQFLNGLESVLYLVKFTFLYRVVLLSLLNVPSEEYSTNLIDSVEEWEEWQSVLDDFLDKLKV